MYMEHSFTALIQAVFTHPWDEQSRQLLRQAQKENPCIQEIHRNVGESIYLAGSPVTHVYLLTRGVCHVVSVSCNGYYSTLYVNSAPTQYGLLEKLADKSAYSATLLSASGDCGLLMIPADTFVELLEQNPSAMIYILRSQAIDMDYNLDNNLRRAMLSPKERLILFLYESASTSLLPFTFRLSRTDLSTLLAINLRTLYRYTDALVAEGALSLRRGKLCVTEENLVRLRELSAVIYEIL